MTYPKCVCGNNAPKLRRKIHSQGEHIFWRCLKCGRHVKDGERIWISREEAKRILSRSGHDISDIPVENMPSENKTLQKELW